MKSSCFQEVRFFPRTVAEKMQGSPHAVFISFHDLSEPPATLDPAWKDVLYIRCHDKDEECLGLELFSSQQAVLVDEFLKKNADAQQIYVHCSLGQSRSGGMALALSEFFGVPCFKQDSPVSTFSYKIYNKKVYSTTLQTLHGDVQFEGETKNYEDIFKNS